MRYYKKPIKHIFLVLGVVCIIGNIVGIFSDVNYIKSLKRVTEQTVIFMVWGSSLWLGMEYIYFKISDEYSWDKEPYKILITIFLLSLLYGLVVGIILSYLVFVIYYKMKYDQFIHETIAALIMSLTISFFFSLAGHAMDFFKNWRKSILNEENFKRERLALQYETLKNQVNPHFLFNSLNILTSLVFKDANLAARFIKQLSEVYRYVLDQKDKELISLTEEIKFVESYIFLQKMRFEEGLCFYIDISPEVKGMIIPLSLQMLVENAIKHNTISKQDPLCIRISADNNIVTVRNNLQKKAVMKDSSNIGLNNIKARYEFLTHEPFIVEDDGKEFIVKLPLIKIA